MPSRKQTRKGKKKRRNKEEILSLNSETAYNRVLHQSGIAVECGGDVEVAAAKRSVFVEGGSRAQNQRCCCCYETLPSALLSRLGRNHFHVVISATCKYYRTNALSIKSVLRGPVDHRQKLAWTMECCTCYPQACSFTVFIMSLVS